jgi:hypothetical protein
MLTNRLAIDRPSPHGPPPSRTSPRHPGWVAQARSSGDIPGALVHHVDRRLPRPGSDRDGDPPAGRRVLHRVVQQDVQHLLDRAAAGQDHRRRRQDRPEHQVADRRRVGPCLQPVPDHPAGVDRHQLRPIEYPVELHEVAQRVAHPGQVGGQLAVYRRRLRREVRGQPLQPDLHKL